MADKTALVECNISDNKSNRSEAFTRFKVYSWFYNIKRFRSTPTNPWVLVCLYKCYIGRRGEGAFSLEAIDGAYLLISMRAAIILTIHS